MKTSLLILLAAWLLPPDHTKTDQESGEIGIESKNVTIVVDNIYGEIQVKRNASNSVKYTITKEVSAGSESKMNRGWDEIQVAILERNDSIIFYLKAPFICDQWTGCQQDGRWIRREKSDYDFSFDFTLEVPAHANLDLQTIDQGEVSVTDVEGILKVNNVNGGVVIRGAKSVAAACTINGDVDVYFKEKPDLDGAFKTINGEISLYCNGSLDAIVNAKTMNGSFYTAFDFQNIAPRLNKISSKNGESTTYQIDETFAIEIGQQGPRLSFETLNGNIYLRNSKGL